LAKQEVLELNNHPISVNQFLAKQEVLELNTPPPYSGLSPLDFFLYAPKSNPC
jgi:hypothetical protein